MNNMKKLFCSKNHNRASESLRESLAALGRRICTEFVDPKSLESYIACRAIALNKNDGNGGIRPIGIGEIIRRVLGKAIAQIFGDCYMPKFAMQQDHSKPAQVKKVALKQQFMQPVKYSRWSPQKPFY